MSPDKHAGSSMTSVVLLKYRDKPAWNLAFEILERAGIELISEGGLGMVEICVRADQADIALSLLRKEPRLHGKLFSANDLR